MQSWVTRKYGAGTKLSLTMLRYHPSQVFRHQSKHHIRYATHTFLRNSYSTRYIWCIQLRKEFTLLFIYSWSIADDVRHGTNIWLYVPVSRCQHLNGRKNPQVFNLRIVGKIRVQIRPYPPPPSLPLFKWNLTFMHDQELNSYFNITWHPAHAWAMSWEKIPPLLSFPCTFHTCALRMWKEVKLPTVWRSSHTSFAYIILSPYHRLKYGVRSPKFIWAPVYSCTHWLRFPLPPHLGS